MIRLLPLVFILACSHSKLFKKEYITLSQSPCVDGTVLNVDQAGCEGFYWGAIGPNQEILKIRCTYAPESHWWTAMSFYAVPIYRDIVFADWSLYCEDRYVRMYAAGNSVKFNFEQGSEE